MGVILIVIGFIGMVIQIKRQGGLFKDMSLKAYLQLAFWLILFMLGVMNLN